MPVFLFTKAKGQGFVLEQRLFPLRGADCYRRFYLPVTSEWVEGTNKLFPLRGADYDGHFLLETAAFCSTMQQSKLKQIALTPLVMLGNAAIEDKTNALTALKQQNYVGQCCNRG